MRIGSNANALNGISMQAAANVVLKSDGANATACSISDDGTTVSIGASKVTFKVATGATFVGGAFTVNGPGSSGPGAAGILSVNAHVGQTSEDSAIYGLQSGSFDATAADRTAYGLVGIATASKSAGANVVTNMAFYGYAAGADVNYALYAADGGDVALAGATDKLGFYGTAPIAKQTGVAVSTAAIHAALVALGIIGV